MSHARTKQQKLEQAKRLLLIRHQTGIGDAELAHELGVPYNSAWRYRRELGAIAVSPGRFKLVPTQADIELARAILEATCPEGQQAPEGSQASERLHAKSMEESHSGE